MIVLALVLYTLSLLAVEGDREDDLRLRLELASAVAIVTEDPEERLVLMRIARFESNYRRDVADCIKRGEAGEVTAWQILPRSRAEEKRLCVSYEEDARIALERVRESVRACRHLAREDRLAIYARGSCGSKEGARLSRTRYPSRWAVDLLRRLATSG